LWKTRTNQLHHQECLHSAAAGQDMSWSDAGKLHKSGVPPLPNTSHRADKSSQGWQEFTEFTLLTTASPLSPRRSPFSLTYPLSLSQALYHCRTTAAAVLLTPVDVLQAQALVTNVLTVHQVPWLCGLMEEMKGLLQQLNRWYVEHFCRRDHLCSCSMGILTGSSLLFIVRQVGGETQRRLGTSTSTATNGGCVGGMPAARTGRTGGPNREGSTDTKCTGSQSNTGQNNEQEIEKVQEIQDIENVQNIEILEKLEKLVKKVLSKIKQHRKRPALQGERGWEYHVEQVHVGRAWPNEREAVGVACFDGGSRHDENHVRICCATEALEWPYICL
jgi:hypothetical protein